MSDLDLSYEAFVRDVENITDGIELKKASSTSRKGMRGSRDRIVSGKFCWTEAFTYITIIQSLVIFSALIPESVRTVNHFMVWLGVPFVFPVEWGSVGVVFFLVGVFVFGFLAVRRVGTYRAFSEISVKMNPGFFALWKQNKLLTWRVSQFENKKE